MELVVSGSGGLDVIKTCGLGPNTEHFQRRRSYRRLNVIPWAYQDDYFIYRGTRYGVVHQADALVLPKDQHGYQPSGSVVTALLTLPAGCRFDRLRYRAQTPEGTGISVSLLDKHNSVLLENVKPDQPLAIASAVRIQFEFATDRKSATPTLDAYALSFCRTRP